MNSEDHKKVCYELNRIYDKKNRDYGDSFHTSYKDYGLIVAAIRIGDKYNRLHSLVSRNDKPLVGESVRDTLLDLANYAIMTIMEIDAEAPEWTKEEPFKKTWEETLKGQKDVH